MNPQDNTQANTQANANNQPQAQQDPNAQSFDGFGGANMSYANYNDQIVQQQQLQQQQMQDPGAVPINVVNANGVVSGKKVVDYVWQRIAVCMLVLAAGLFIGVCIVLFVAISKSTEMAKLEIEKKATEMELNSIYGHLGVSDLTGAITRIEAKETMNGGDLAEVNTLLTNKFGANYKLDLADSNINFVVRNGVYKVVSLGIYRESGTQRAVLYEKISDGKWKLGGYDANKADPCADSTAEEKDALDGVIPCSEDKK